MKTKIDIFFCFVDNFQENGNITPISSIEYVRHKTLRYDNKTAAISNDELICLLKKNKENGYNFDESWLYNHHNKRFEKMNTNDPIIFFNNHYANAICVFYKEKDRAKVGAKTRKIKYDATHKKTKKNIQIPIKLL